MTATIIGNIKFANEFIQYECEERNYKEINLDVFSDGVQYVANKLFMCFGAFKKGYFIILNTDKGTLVSNDFNSIEAEGEFRYLSRQDSAARQGLRVSVNFLSYTFYNKNVEKVIKSKSGFIDNASFIAA